MEIIETVPIYGPPAWPIITFFVGLGILILCGMFLNNTEYAGIITLIIGTVVVFVGLIFYAILHKSEFSHNEYIVRITDIPAQEFVEKYKVTKRFDYSDVIQVREIEKK
jgi:predicted membrane channel-forming protein YqfA (hemolysin III family)